LRFKKRGTNKRGRPKKNGAGEPHQRRRPVSRRMPIHVTWRFVSGVKRLRRFKVFKVLRKVVGKATVRFDGFRIVHFSLMNNHLHLIVEAEHVTVLSRGMQGLGVRLARQFNGLLNREGGLMKDRFHMEVANTPRQTRHMVAYVLNNARRHRDAPSNRPDWIDPFSSARWFDGWARWTARPEPETSPVSEPRSHLLKSAWKIHGLIDRSEVPGPLNL
jgi:REP element-mobilizing transposase RayT